MLFVYLGCAGSSLSCRLFSSCRIDLAEKSIPLYSGSLQGRGRRRDQMPIFSVPAFSLLDDSYIARKERNIHSWKGKPATKEDDSAT